MSYIILTERHDFHAYIVKSALSNIGAKVSIFFTDELTSLPNLSIYYNNNGQNVILDGEDVFNKSVSSIWLRRIILPRIDPKIDLLNANYNKNENLAFIESLYYQLSDRFRCINPYSGRLAARRKGHQLYLAHRSGLNIPNTLITNSVDKMRCFIKENYNDTIIKPFFFQRWDDNGKISAFFASVITETDLPKTPMVAQSNILQNRIQKKYDVRIIAFGDYFISVRIHSDIPDNIIDYKEYPNANMEIIKFNIPDEIKNKCITIMLKLNIVFAVFDFIEDKDGNFIFLEINESAQFLFIEQINNEIRLLDIFCQFFRFEGDPFNFSNCVVKSGIKCSDFEDSAWNSIKCNDRTSSGREQAPNL